ncbi:MAG: type 1 glutamine amidotransferase [Rhodobacter sp.]|nr:type 1 glutamine amidotransferase [Paracoccaceae bacterium]MCC0075132.1 type 1 glutamine amidotransferase [Rhodobacter sp.]
MHIAFLDANTDTSDFGRSHPSEADKFRALMAPAAPGWTITGYKVSAGEAPDSLDGIDGIMISGSVASVNDADPWVARLLDLIRQAVTRHIPIYGTCFGHQAVAKALGGSVGDNPQGWVLGRYETRVHAPAPWMEGLTGPMGLHAAHKEQVVTPPPGATIHAGTPEVPYGHMSVGPRVFTTQYHPELSHDFMHGLLDELAGAVDAGILAGARESLSQPVDDAQMARWIAAFFAQAHDHPRP